MNIFKELNNLKREKSEAFSYYRNNEHALNYLNSKRVQSGRDTKEIFERMKLKREISDDMYSIEQQIDNILIENPRVQLIGYAIHTPS
jgi:hypothetical protein